MRGLIRCSTLLLVLIATACLGCTTSAPKADIPPPKAHEKVVDADFRTQTLSEAQTNNTCPKGLERLNGQWTFAGETKAKGFRNRLVFRDAKFTEFLVGGESAQEHGIVRGRYHCVDKGRLVFFVDSVEPEGAFENYSKDIYTCLIMWGIGELNGQMMLRCNFDWNPKKDLEFVYTHSGR